MSQAALTARYRPQAFAEVAGQDTIKTILSRASLEGKVAPAYLFSGTRGVGKTTLARIFAKALNCRTAPTAEPCNQCDQCRAITAGNAVDVVEIDGASNRGIDDVRRLKEVVGYAPMEGGYKIFIIDEAHMLSREAFNALLKTLEEPPARVTFVMATTEPHKFPATIISRCQHYVFKRLPENALVEHLSGVLRREGVEYEESALRLIARRGAGSVRDSMSLLGQVLALGEGRLTEEAARNVLGLAGQEAFMQMLEAFKNGDSVVLSTLLREMLDQGLDMGFFLRELASLWRNLFMLRQSGEAALPVVELPEKEARACLEIAQGFSLQHIHACWQMTLDGQRRVLASLEPALALELLLLNIAMLPKLLSLESLSAQTRKAGPPASSPPPSPQRPSGAPTTGTPSSSPPAGGGRSDASSVNAQSPSATREHFAEAPSMDGRDEPDDATSREMPMPASASREQGPMFANLPPGPDEVPCGADAAERTARDEAVVSQSGSRTVTAPDEREPAGTAEADAPAIATAPEDERADISQPASPAETDSQSSDATLLHHWQELLRLCEETRQPAWLLQLLQRMEAAPQGKSLRLIAQDDFSADRMRADDVREILHGLFTTLCGHMPELDIRGPVKKRKSREDLKAEILVHPLVREVEDQLGARVLDFGQMR